LLAQGAFTVTVDSAFSRVVDACGEGREGGTWITEAIKASYRELHAYGWAHSIEVWGSDGALAGGLYGVAVGGCFSGESMFHCVTNASKVAFAATVQRLRSSQFRLFDVQVLNPHLASLGCVELSRDDFLTRLDDALTQQPRWQALSDDDKRD